MKGIFRIGKKGHLPALPVRASKVESFRLGDEGLGVGHAHRLLCGSLPRRGIVGWEFSVEKDVVRNGLNGIHKTGYAVVVFIG